MATGGTPPPPPQNPTTNPAGPLSEQTARRLALAMELLRRDLRVGGVAGAFANRDRGGPPPEVLAALAGAAVAAAGGGKGGAAANGPTPVVVIGWRAGPINVNVAGGDKAATGRDAAASYEDAMRRAGSGFGWGEMWKGLRDQPAEKAGGGPAAAAAKRDDGAGVGRALAGTLGRVMLPLVAMGTILSQNNSGMTALGKSSSLLAATLAPVLLPVVMLVAAGLLTVSDVIWAELKPKLGEWARWIVSTGIPAVTMFADAVKYATGVLGVFVRGMRGGPQEKGQAVKDLDTIFGEGFADMIVGKEEADRQRGRRRGSGAGDWEGGAGSASGRVNIAPPPAAPNPWSIDALLGAAPPGGIVGGMAAVAGRRGSDLAGRPGQPGRPGGTEGKVVDNLELVMTSITRSLLPKAEFTTGAGASRARQLAGANGDPLDMKALLRSIESVREVTAGVRDAVRGNAPPPRPQVPPGGEPFRGDF